MTLAANVDQPMLCAELTLSLLRQLCTTDSTSAVLQLWVGGVQRLTDCDRAEIYLLDQGHSLLVRHMVADAGGARPDNGYQEQADYHHDSLLSTSLLRQTPIHLDSPLQNGRLRLDFLSDAEHSLRFDSMLTALPIRDRQGQNQGVLLLMGRHGRSRQQHTAPLEALGASFWQQYILHQQLSDGARHQQSKPKSRPAPLKHSYGLTGRSKAVQQLQRLISKTLHHQSCVLITGETGTGKELVAQAIHHHGPRRSRPFLVQNCASIPEHLLESELFGYKRGAFTGADRDHPGLIRAAEGGTLFLDEIGDMSLSLQAKLLRVLQEKNLRPLGDTQSYEVDVRILAATHQNLLEMVEQGSFRRDLYYRLAQFPIALPPLRERKDDIAPLAQLFAEEFAHHAHMRIPPFSQALFKKLGDYAFPGNIRELKNIIERTLLLHAHEAELQPGHLPDELFHVSEPDGRHQQAGDLGTGKLDERLDYLECQVLEQVLRKYHGNQKLAAQELGLSRGAMNYRLKKHHINARDWRI